MPRTMQCAETSFPDRDTGDRDAERVAPKAKTHRPTGNAARRGFTTKRRPVTPADARRAKLIPVSFMPGWPTGGETLQVNARNAAKLALRGKQWSAEDRAECAAEVTCRIIELETARKGFSGDWIGHGAATVSRCYQLAGDWMRHAEVVRNADARREALDAAMSQFVPNITPWDAEGSTMCRAAMKAAEIGDAIGDELADRKTAALIYSAARTSDGMTSGEAMAELGFTPAAGRKAAERARKAALKRGSAEDWRVALAEDDRTPGMVRGTNLADMRDDVRKVAPGPVACRKDKAARRDMRRDVAPRWARDLRRDRPATAARLAKAAERKRTRSQGRTADERRMLRRSAGLPATVR